MRAWKKMIVLGVALALALAVMPALAKEEHKGGHAGPHWTYEGNNGPAHWGDLDNAFEACKVGKEQSPIDVPGTAPKSSRKLEIHYQPAPVDLVNNGHTLQMTVAPGSYIVLDGTRYDLVQFHFHTPGENAVAGKTGDMVVHFVHKNAKGALAVIDVRMTAGAANPVVTALWKFFPKKADEKALDKSTVNPAGMLPGSQTFYSFAGSLTTPPCSEGVTWMVMDQTISVDAKDLKTFGQVFGKNARPLQPMGSRKFN
ncbi:MAG: carbonic anhydrase family protein [Deltaproteobacteria bacterium]|nr:carbonic anhydrase family protein [Deltaproteobacteria bacterium]